MLRLDYDDVQAYLNCPQLFAKFRSKPEPVEPEVYLDCFLIALRQQMQLSQTPPARKLATLWGRELHRVKGKTVKEYNNGIIMLSSAYEQYVKMNMNAVAINLRLSEGFGNIIFEDVIHAVLASPPKEEAVPVFFTDSGSRAFKSNKIRFLSSMLEEKSGVPVKEYLTVSRDLKILRFSFKDGELKRAREELATIINQIKTVSYPNTGYCSVCPAFSRCIL